tara:strand:+ start:247 stop:963 length:717 start_codon:yes stop_codon:yes gene_type:complete
MAIILSTHIPKTAGSFFGQALLGCHPEILFYNYGPKSRATRIYQRGQLLNLHEGKDHKDVFLKKSAQYKEEGLAIMHGHFWIRSYSELIPPAKPIVWLREPAQRLRSHFEFWKNPPKHKNPKYKLFKKENFSFVEFATHPEFTNRQYLFTNGVSLNNFVFVGIMEQMENSLNTLSDILPCFPNTNPNIKVNFNPLKESEKYNIGKDEMALIRKANELDYMLYESGLSILKANMQRSKT